MHYFIRELREDNDISQAKAARLFYVSKNTYIRYETGEREPPFSFMVRVAEYYGVSLDWIAGRTDKRTLDESG